MRTTEPPDRQFVIPCARRTARNADKTRRLEIGDELRLVRDFYEPAAGEAGVRLSVEAPQKLTFSLDRTLFQRAVGNLIQNALAHTPIGGEVRIQAQNGTGQ